MKEREVYISIKKRDLELLLSNIDYLSNRVRELEQRLNKTSKNSSKPPSSDGYKKEVKNNRVKSGRKSGAQKGHKGTTLKMVESPDKIIDHNVSGKCECGEDLSKLPISKTYKRQVFDLPAKLLEVTEHRVEVKMCKCGKLHEAYCEHGNHVQYGNKIKSLATYLNQYQLLPFQRLQELIKDVIGVSIGDGTLDKSNKECFENLEQTELDIIEILVKANVLHNDETGMRSQNKTKWVHSASTQKHTHYAMHEKRGKEAMDKIGILSRFLGTSVHDRWASYEKYGFDHAYCNAHILRDLKFLHENMGVAWASEMIGLLTMANKAKKENKLTLQMANNIKEKYNNIIAKAIEIEKKKKAPIKPKPKRGRPPTSKTLRMINMFFEKQKEVLRFIDYEEVPFDNNLAERDLRMVKLKQKISGCFRSDQGQETFFRTRSYISTVRKQGQNVFQAIELAMMGSPLDIKLAEQ